MDSCVRSSEKVAKWAIAHRGDNVALPLREGKGALRRHFSLLGLLEQSTTRCGAKTTEMHYLVVLEAGSLKAGCWRGCLLLGVRQEVLHALP